MSINPQVSRRTFLATVFGATILGVATPASALAINTFDIEVTRFTLPSQRLPINFVGYRIALLTDIHLGVFMPDDVVATAVNLINNEKPDLVLLGGDYIGVPDSFPGILFDPGRNLKFAKAKSADLIMSIYNTLSKILSGLNAPDGSLGILGNHDNWNDRKLCFQGLSSPQINILVNQYQTIKRGSEQIHIYGIDDLWTGIPRLDALREISASNEFTVALAHNPDVIESNMSNIRYDLAFAGHTHGGQINIPGLGPLVGYNIRSKTLTSGLFSTSSSHVYVSRGIGVVEIPYRLNCRPEISIFELVQG